MALMQAVAVEPGRPGTDRVVTVPKPEPAVGEALVRVLAVGVCGTDKAILAGSEGQAPPGNNRLIIGHESLGVIERAAPGGPPEGTLVAAIVRRPDDCPACRLGQWDMCIGGGFTERGIRGRDGYMAGWYVERPEFLVAVPSLLRDVGVLVEPASVVTKAITQLELAQRRLPWQPARALVTGAGTIGLLASLILRLRGVEVITVDIVPEDSLKATVLREARAIYVNSRMTSIADTARRAGNIDIVIEATGIPPVVFESMAALGTNGAMALVGTSGGNSTNVVDGAALNMGMVMGNKLVLGSVNANRDHFAKAVESLSAIEQRWRGLLARLITRRLPLADFEQVRSPDPDGIKTVIVPGDGAGPP